MMSIVTRLIRAWRRFQMRRIERMLLGYYRDDCARARRHQHKSPDWTEWLRIIFR